MIYSACPASTRGAFRDRHEREVGCGGRDGACDERAAGGRRSRVVLAPRSRRQVRKTPTRRADDGVNKAVVPGESAE